MGLGDFLGGIKDATVNVAKGVGWVADPTHWDDIAEGAGKAAEFVVENPGKTWDTAFEVGRAVVKDQMDPMNLAINAGLLAATVATGGLAGGALAAKIGMGAKSVEAGVTAAKGIDTVADVAKGVKTTAKAIDTVSDVARTGGRISNFAQDVKQTVSGIREAGGLVQRGEKILDTGLELKGAAREAVGLSRYGGMAARRAEAGASIAERGADMGRIGQGITKYAGKKVAGEANPLANPGVYNTADRLRHRYNQVQHIIDTPERIAGSQKAIEAAADPYAAAEEQVAKQVNASTHAAGYSDLGQTSASLYGDTSQTSALGSSSTTPVSQRQLTTSAAAPDLNTQGAPVNFAPEIPKSGMYAQSTGQQPIGSAFPTLTSPGSMGKTSPMYSQGSRTSRRKNLVGI